MAVACKRTDAFMEESNPCRQYLQPHSFSYGTGFPSGRCGRGTVGKYGGRPGSVRIFLAALCLSVQALNCVVWHEARHETVWKTWQKWGVMTVTVLLAVALWRHWGTMCSFDFLHRQYPQVLSGQYDLMHTLAHTLMCKGILSVWHHFSRYCPCPACVASAGLFHDFLMGCERENAGFDCPRRCVPVHGSV